MIEGPRKWVYIGVGGLVLILGLWMLLKPADTGIEDEDLDAVVRAGNKKQVEKLQGFVKSEKAGVAMEALTQLVRVQDKDARETVKAALGDARAEVKTHAAVLYGKVGDPNDPSPLVSLLTDSDASIKAAACAGLGHLRAVDSLETLLGLAEKDNDTQVQQAAVDAAQKIMGIRFAFKPGGSAAERRKQLTHARAEINNTRKLYGKNPR